MPFKRTLMKYIVLQDLFSKKTVWMLLLKGKSDHQVLILVLRSGAL